MRSERFGRPAEASSPGLTARPATVEDAPALAELYLASRAAAHPAIPPSVHPPESVHRWVRSRFDAEDTEVWLAEEVDDLQDDAAAAPVGLLLLEGDWLHSLYVAPGRTGQGAGSLLLAVARSRRPGGLGLYVFTSNERARRFYAGHGFVEVARSDGTGPDGNEEQQPDVEMHWPGPDQPAPQPMHQPSHEHTDEPTDRFTHRPDPRPDPRTIPELRRRIDAVDDQVATLLRERVRLTAAVQALKEVPGHAGRDPVREREIAERMARVAPELGAARLARIMGRVISESLDAAAETARRGARTSRSDG